MTRALFFDLDGTLIDSEPGILGGIAGPDLTATERDFFRAADPWGFILFGRNIDTPDRLRRLTADLREALRRAPDMDRALSRLALDRGGPRDLAAIRAGLTQGAAIAALFTAPPTV
mgnify:CR=1 FL=1